MPLAETEAAEVCREVAGAAQKVRSSFPLALRAAERAAAAATAGVLLGKDEIEGSRESDSPSAIVGYPSNFEF